VGIDGHKKVSILTGHALYLGVKEELDRITRPVVRVRGDWQKDFETLDIGGCAETIGRWREQVLWTLANTYAIADHSRYLPMLAEIEAQEAAWKAGEAAGDG
jgi:hypothetical protein